MSEISASLDAHHDHLEARLLAVFPGVYGPKVLYQTRKDGKQGPPLYALFFLVSNPDPKALALALKFAKAVLKL